MLFFQSLYQHGQTLEETAGSELGDRTAGIWKGLTHTARD